MKSKFIPLILILIFLFSFVIFFKGLKNSNIYTPDTNLKKEVPSLDDINKTLKETYPYCLELTGVDEERRLSLIEHLEYLKQLDSREMMVVQKKDELEQSNISPKELSKVKGLLPSHEELVEFFSLKDADKKFIITDDKSDKELDSRMWNTVKTCIHSQENETGPGRNLNGFVGFENKKGYRLLGVFSLHSDSHTLGVRDNHIGWTTEQNKRHRERIVNMNTCCPTQPFGFNYLGGKLLALLCCSHEAREQLNSKYGSDICLFETTSLYGTTKSSSQYDGLKPYMRYKGLTMSDFTPLLHDDVFKGLNKWFIERNNNKLLVKEDASSRKLKTQQKMISIIKKSSSSQKAAEFQTAIVNAKNLTEKKRVYFSDYGFANSREVIRGDTDKLEKNPINFDKFYQENLIKWWKNKASKRYESLKSSGSLRTELEVWTKDMHIDIIR